jgi:Ser/Thr protein kinase RdoA (MazF antagonist)
MVSKSLLEFAAINYDFDISTLEHIPRNGGKIENKIYSFYKSNKKYIVKFDPPSVAYNNQLRETRAAMDFNYYLAENNINVSIPLKAANGELVISTQDDGKDYIITAFNWLHGETWSFDGSNAKMCYNLGKVMGNIHRLAKDYKPLNEYDVLKNSFNYLSEDSFFDDLKIYPTVYKIAQELFGEITALPKDRDSFGIIHCDMHQGNFHTDGNEINVFDFGDSMYGWFGLDIATSLCFALWWGRGGYKVNDFVNVIIGNFLKGYLSAHQLSDFWLLKIPMFMKYNHLGIDPEGHGIGCNREEWIYYIENDIMFAGCDLKSIADIIHIHSKGGI